MEDLVPISDIPGFPFDHEYPWLDPQRTIAELRDRIRRQVDDFAAFRADPGLRRQLIRALQRRQSSRVVPLTSVPRVDVVQRPAGPATLVAGGELLLARSSFADAGVQRFLETQEFFEVDLGCADLDSRVVRLRNDTLEGDALVSVVRLLRQRGFTASVNHLPPLAPVGKKRIGGGSPVTSPGQFANYPIQVAGSPVTVAVIDGGITEQPRTDGWLDGVPRQTPTGASSVDPLDELPAGGDDFLDFDAGHGTFTAGIVQQVDPQASIVPYRGLLADGLNSEVEVACAMISAVRDGCQIINLSLGCQALDDVPPVALSAALEVIGEIERQREWSSLLIAAAGNEADSTPVWPAAFRRVVGVAALKADLSPAPWSSHGFWVTCSTIGEGVRSTYVEGIEAADLDPAPDTFGPDAWAVWCGTSFAAPQVSGAVARICMEESIGPHEALGRLLAAGRPLAQFGQAMLILPSL